MTARKNGDQRNGLLGFFQESPGAGVLQKQEDVSDSPLRHGRIAAAVDL